MASDVPEAWIGQRVGVVLEQTRSAPFVGSLLGVNDRGIVIDSEYGPEEIGVPPSMASGGEQVCVPSFFPWHSVFVMHLVPGPTG